VRKIRIKAEGSRKNKRRIKRRNGE